MIGFAARSVALLGRLRGVVIKFVGWRELDDAFDEGFDVGYKRATFDAKRGRVRR